MLHHHSTLSGSELCEVLRCSHCVCVRFISNRVLDELPTINCSQMLTYTMVMDRPCVMTGVCPCVMTRSGVVQSVPDPQIH